LLLGWQTYSIYHKPAVVRRLWRGWYFDFARFRVSGFDAPLWPA
jgi:hypothetical protein